MFELFKRLVLRIAKVPAEPHPPAGSLGSIKTFRAAANYWKYLLVMWGIKQVFGAIAIFFFLSLSAAWLASTERAPATPAPVEPNVEAPAAPQEDARIPEGRRKRARGRGMPLVTQRK